MTRFEMSHCTSLLNLDFAGWCLLCVNVAFESTNWRFCGMMLSIFPTCIWALELSCGQGRYFCLHVSNEEIINMVSKKKSCGPVDRTTLGGSGSVATSGQGCRLWLRGQCLRGAWWGWSQSPRGIMSLTLGLSKIETRAHPACVFG